MLRHLVLFIVYSLSFFFFKQKTAYEMRISDWSSDVCSSDLGIPITEALTTIGDESTDVAIRRAISGMVDDLRNGGLLSAAASQYPQVFPNYYIGILQAAELTGRLDESLDSLSRYIEREIETRAKVIGAMAYPLVVMALAMVTVLILAGYVLPQFKPLFEELNADLPLPTRIM